MICIYEKEELIFLVIIVKCFWFDYLFVILVDNIIVYGNIFIWVYISYLDRNGGILNWGLINKDVNFIFIFVRNIMEFVL